ncbi:hypothetical protein GE09DRAFT_388901 [Coniochaeta sp. 2T2.1]|nr:hypothetical protein GE09DRAFT_388901 [Coniochaeta sp. 2T2.1]
MRSLQTKQFPAVKLTTRRNSPIVTTLKPVSWSSDPAQSSRMVDICERFVKTSRPRSCFHCPDPPTGSLPAECFNGGDSTLLDPVIDLFTVAACVFHPSVCRAPVSKALLSVFNHHLPGRIFVGHVMYFESLACGACFCVPIMGAPSPHSCSLHLPSCYKAGSWGQTCPDLKPRGSLVIRLQQQTQRAINPSLDFISKSILLSDS